MLSSNHPLIQSSNCCMNAVSYIICWIVCIVSQREWNSSQREGGRQTKPGGRKNWFSSVSTELVDKIFLMMSNILHQSSRSSVWLSVQSVFAIFSDYVWYLNQFAIPSQKEYSDRCAVRLQIRILTNEAPSKHCIQTTFYGDDKNVHVLWQVLIAFWTTFWQHQQDPGLIRTVWYVCT